MPYLHYADQTDPERNLQFRRRWSEMPTDAAALDRLADLELQHGHRQAAERLAWRAAAMREVLV